jgi:hypothetical protein
MCPVFFLFDVENRGKKSAGKSPHSFYSSDRYKSGVEFQRFFILAARQCFGGDGQYDPRGLSLGR